MDGDQTASLSSLLARKATFLLALIWIGSPVTRIAAHAGNTIPHLQNPKSNDLHALAHFRCLVIMPMRSSIIFRACRLLS